MATRWGDDRGALAPMFALALLVIVALVFGAVTVGMGVAQKSRAQDAVDAAALWAVPLLANANYNDTQVIKEAQNYLALRSAKDPAIAKSTVSVDREAKEVLITYSSPLSGGMVLPLLGGPFEVSAKARAKLGSGLWPVCILITEPTDNHTLRASNGAKVDLNNCLVQVNTRNWDAVEAKDSSYIHIKDGENCYVGDIHFGDITPAKMPTCDLFSDPFSNISVNAPSKCDYTEFEITGKTPKPAPLEPGVYCKGLSIGQAVTFNPGVYYIKDGPLEISGPKTNVKADGVTFLLSGEDAGVEINSDGHISMSPAKKAVAGKFDGFVFFLDQSILTEPSATSQIEGADVKMSGTIYLKGQHFVIGNGARIKIDSGSIIAGYLLPQGGDLTFKGKLSSASAASAAMKKSIDNVPRLVN